MSAGAAVPDSPAELIPSMRSIFPILLLIEIIALVVAAYLGLTLEDGQDGTVHLKAGLLAAIYTMFLHCLVMFYLIGSGKDVKSATEDYPDLWEEYILRSKRIRGRVFPWSSLSVITILVAAFAGAYVHAELIAGVQHSLPRNATIEEVMAAPLPVRDVPLWWTHLTFLIIALVVNVPAFFLEKQAIADNGSLIEELNEKLQAKIFSRNSPDASSEAPPESSGSS